MSKSSVYDSILCVILNEKLISMDFKLKEIKNFVEDYDMSLEADEIASIKETLLNHLQWLETRLKRPSGTA